jgi:hypothetical protein
MNENVKLMVATPMYGGMCVGWYNQSMMALANAVKMRGWEFQSVCQFNESLIQRARNALTKAFLKTDCTHLLFIDADIKFDPMHIIAMVEADIDLLAGIYPKKEINWHSVAEAVHRGVPVDQLKHYTGSFVVNLLDGVQSATIPSNLPLEVLNAGTGCMLIKRRVFEVLEPITDSYMNDVTDLSGVLQPEPIHAFFDVTICPESDRLLSEDYHFCQAWRRAGGKVYVAPWVVLSHIGTYEFEGRLLPENENA